MFIAVTAIPAAFAQSQQVARAEIPFDFYASGQKLPAGTYEVGLDVETKMITLMDRSNDHMKFLSGYQNDDGSIKPELVFNRIGASYVLKEIETDDLGVAVPEAKSSKLEGRSDVASVHVDLLFRNKGE
jgi:hypothetical protein